MTAKTKLSKEQLQEQILKSRKLERAGRGRLIKPTIKQDFHKSGYTKSMIVLELLLDTDLSEFLFSDSESKIAKMLGVDKSTVSRWRKRLESIAKKQ